MAFPLLTVLLLGVLAAANDVPTIWSTGRTLLPCTPPPGDRPPPRRAPPPPPLDADTRRGRFTWTRDGEELPRKRIFPNGTLEAHPRREPGVYRCTARAGAGAVLGLPVRLRMPTIDKSFTRQPSDAAVPAGRAAALPCAVPSEPRGRPQWTRDGAPVVQDDRHYILPEELFITEVTPEDEGYYRCTVTNDQLNKTRVSQRARLQVVAPAALAPQTLALQHEPAVAVEAGADAVLVCPVTGWPRPEITWEMTPPRGRTAELEVTAPALPLRRAGAADAGAYSCRVPGVDGLAWNFTVTVLTPVSIATPPRGRATPRAGTARLNCTAEGSPPPRVTWYKDGKLLELGGRTKLLHPLMEDREELVVSSFTTEDAGIYQCFATNNHSWASAWAAVNVTGEPVPAPTALRCRPLDARTVSLAWQHGDLASVVAFTVDRTPLAPPHKSITGPPLTSTRSAETLAPLTPYALHVRVYAARAARSKASDLSAPVVCQGQGVPVQLSRLNGSSVRVSWEAFAQQTPGVAQWILQYREDGSELAQNVTLAGDVLNYTLVEPPSGHLLVRLLGSRSETWLQQDLGLVAWTSSAGARGAGDGDELTPAPTGLRLTEVTADGFSFAWTPGGAETPAPGGPETPALRGPDAPALSYVYCVRREDELEESCQQSASPAGAVSGLRPGRYAARVRARLPPRPPSAYSPPLDVLIVGTEPHLFLNVTYQFVNRSTALVSWQAGAGAGAAGAGAGAAGAGAGAGYTVHYSSQLKVPVEVWHTLEVYDDHVLITADPKEQTYVMVKSNESPENSRIITIPNTDSVQEPISPQYTIKDGVVLIRWRPPAGAGAGAGAAGGAGATGARVRYEQGGTWKEVDTDENTIQLPQLDPARPARVQVLPAAGAPSAVFTVPAARDPTNKLYYGAGAAAAAAALAAAAAALCVWRRRKRLRSPRRSRPRRSASPDSRGDDAELKSVGGRLANGGAGAGEPLLNGHAPAARALTKTPNGRPRRDYSAAFDVSRPAADTALDDRSDLTALTDLTGLSSLSNMLDTSRRTASANSFGKQQPPDDNMNSEPAYCQPALPPNG